MEKSHFRWTSFWGAGQRLIGPDDSYLQFLEKSDKSTLVDSELIPKLRSWIESGRGQPYSGDFGKHIQLLIIMKETLYFEANRPFDRYWYTEKPVFHLTAVNEDQIPNEPASVVAPLCESLRVYIADTQAYVTSA